MEKHIITRTGVFNTQVCSEGTFDEALEFIRETAPAGTTGNWFKDERENVKPVQCEKYPARTHYLFVC